MDFPSGTISTVQRMAATRTLCSHKPPIVRTESFNKIVSGVKNIPLLGTLDNQLYKGLKIKLNQPYSWLFRFVLVYHETRFVEKINSPIQRAFPR